MSWSKGKGMTFSAFCMGISSSIGMLSLQSSVGYWAHLYGKESFIWLNVAVYATALPVSMFLAWLNANEIPKCRTDHYKLFCDTRRVVFCILSVALACLILPAFDSFFLVLTSAAFIGCFSAFILCTAIQVVMRHSPNGVFEAAFTFGNQAAVFLVLVCEMQTHFQPGATKSNEWFFFSSIALSLILTTAPTIFFATRMSQLDVQPDEAQPLSAEEMEESFTAENHWSELLASREVVGAFTALSLTSFGSLAIFPFYSYVPSASTEPMAEAMLSLRLFYVKSICDSIARPFTLILPKVTSVRLLIVASCMRLIFVAVFLAYCFYNWFEKNDLLITALVGLHSFMSGYLVTSSYQIVTLAGFEKAMKRQASSFLNIGFQLGIFFAFAFALTIYFAVVST